MEAVTVDNNQFVIIVNTELVSDEYTHLTGLGMEPLYPISTVIGSVIYAALRDLIIVCGNAHKDVELVNFNGYVDMVFDVIRTAICGVGTDYTLLDINSVGTTAHIRFCKRLHIV